MKSFLNRVRQISWLPWVYIGLFVLLVPIALETLNVAGSPPFPYLLLAVGLFLIIGLFLFSVTSSVFVSGSIITILVSALYIVNSIRRDITGFVLTPSDILLAGKIGNILSFVNIKPDVKIFIVVGVIILLLAGLFIISPMVKLNLRNRMLMMCLSLAILLTTFTVASERLSAAEKISAAKRYGIQGVFVGFMSLGVMDVGSNVSFKGHFGGVIPPDNGNITEIPYGLSLMSLISDELAKNPPPPMSDKRPDVVVIMSEAFSDPLLFPGVSYTDDPMKNFRELAQQGASGKILTPAFGGGTCNPEYEFLTGNLIVNVGAGHMPYQMMDDYIKEDDLRSLPSQLKANGYKTVGVHTYHGDFFNRNIIYPKLGFDEFISMDEMEGAEDNIKGKFPSDKFFTDQIIAELNKADESNEPLFVYGISMENHYEYYDNKLDSPEIFARGEGLSAELNGALKSYARGVADADIELKRLVDYLSQRERPTVLFFFGDHLPIIGDKALQVFNETGRINSDNIEAFDEQETMELFSTPYLLWSNYDLPVSKKWQDMSTYYIGPMILDVCGLDRNKYYQFLINAYEKLHGAIPGLYMDSEGRISKELPKDLEALVYKIRMIQFDTIEGNQYAKSVLREMYYSGDN